MRMTTLGSGELGTSSPTSSPHQEPSCWKASGSGDDVVKTGVLRKFKGKKKWFVVRRESESGPARLEYYAKERYFRLGQPPRRTIGLKACFNINRTDSKLKWAIALHTHNDCLRIVFSSEEEMKEWLQLLNSLAGTEEEPSEDVPSKPHFEHVWLVQALNKGLGSKENILGPYRLCLTSRELTLLKIGDGDERNSLLKFPLNVIRAVSHDSTFGCFFNIEFGRSAVTGPGLLSLRTEDNNIAQNMHLLIVKAMHNYPKEELVHRDGPKRGRTYTWNSGYSGYSDSSSRPSSIISQTPPVINRINSVDSGTPRVRTESINSSDSRYGASPPISISLSLSHQTPPTISFHSPLCSTTGSASSSYSVDYENNNNGDTRPHEEEQGSYVPWNPSEEPALSLPLQPLDTAEYVTTGGQRLGSRTSSYLDRSPLSSSDNYLPMSPGTSTQAGAGNGKISFFHSRNSSLIEDVEGYVPMVPGQTPSTASANGIESHIDSYLEMDLSSNRQKPNLSNEERSLPGSSIESLQSRTPSSDFPLEKVSSYFLPSDDIDDSSGFRPVRAYSVGSRSDTGTTLKERLGKARLESVQENFRIRALSVGAKNPRTNKGMGLFSPPPRTPPNSSVNGSTSSISTGPQLSSSWSGSTGRWAQIKSQMSPASSGTQHSRQNSEQGDSDLMELDFSHNREKKGRRKSLSGIRESTSNNSSPCSKGVLSESPDAYMQMQPMENLRYASSAPITIQKPGGEIRGIMGGAPLVSGMTRLDLNSIHQANNAEGGEYMPMDCRSPTELCAPVVARTLENVLPVPFTVTTTESNHTSSQTLSRIEESPEKQEGATCPPVSQKAKQSTIEEEPVDVTYADVEHPRTGGSHPLTISKRPCYPQVTYSQIDFKKTPTS